MGPGPQRVNAAILRQGSGPILGIRSGQRGWGTGWKHARPDRAAAARRARRGSARLSLARGTAWIHAGESARPTGA